MSWPTDPLPYQVRSPDGGILYQSLITCRHPPRIERMLLESGCTILVEGRKLTKKELSQRAQNKTL
nr:MAG TPA: hypothetical protein [Caudoviricetes sp.]